MLEGRTERKTNNVLVVDVPQAAVEGTARRGGSALLPCMQAAALLVHTALYVTSSEIFHTVVLVQHTELPGLVPASVIIIIIVTSNGVHYQRRCGHHHHHV